MEFPENRHLPPEIQKQKHKEEDAIVALLNEDSLNKKHPRMDHAQKQKRVSEMCQPRNHYISNPRQEEVHRLKALDRLRNPLHQANNTYVIAKERYPGFFVTPHIDFIIVKDAVQQKFEDKLTKATKYYEQNTELVEAYRIMEELVQYSQEIGGFERLATLGVMMRFIDQIMKSGKHEQALRLVNKVGSK